MAPDAWKGKRLGVGVDYAIPHPRFWAREGLGPWFPHGSEEEGQLPGCVGTWLPPPHGVAMTRAQVTQHLQLEPPTTCLACWLQYSRAAGRQARGLGSLVQPQEA